MNRVITYALHSDGYVVSRVGSEVAWPVLQYDKMTPETGFSPVWELERMPVLDVSVVSDWRSLRWTKKIPLGVKQVHRRFWGFRELR